MATDPAFAATPVNGAALLGAAETSLTAPTTTSTILTAGGNGTKVEEIMMQATATTVAGLVYLFDYDGSTYHLFDTISVSAVTASTTTAPNRNSKTYNNLTFASGHSLRASQSIAGNASLLMLTAWGGNL
jgi:hypothetical protein